MDNSPVILILATQGESTTIVYNTLRKNFKSVNLIIEEKTSSKTLFKNRVKKIGLIKSIGQVFFIFTIPSILRRTSKKRINEINQKYNINSKEIPANKIKNIKSINSPEVIELIDQIKPSIIIVNGTRILSKALLEKINTPIINIHTGITPFYRGVHGGYWALANNDKNNFGTTIHFVDKGIDTGRIIKQFRTTPDKSDNFSTYPLLQYAIILDELPNIIYSIINKQSDLPSNITNSKGNLWYHPTIWYYLYKRIFKGVK